MPEFQNFTSEEIKEFVSVPRFDPEVLKSKDARYTKISVAIPSFNQVEFLERTLLSIFNQNYPNTEVIIYDAGSTDGTLELIEKYRDYIDFFVCEPDEGQYDAINKGFRKATGQLIGWQNTDDLYLPGFFHACHRVMQRRPNTGWIIANLAICDEKDDILWSTEYSTFDLEYLLRVDWNLSSQGVFVTSRLLEEVGLLRTDIAIAGDYDWFIRVGRADSNPVLMRRMSSVYRLHSATKLSNFDLSERLRTEIRILRANGLPARYGVAYVDQWPLRRRWLQFKERCARALLYGKRPLGRRLSPFYRVLQTLRGRFIYDG
jgi:glycosyltransferase involved in cell wall biosynthesis